MSTNSPRHGAQQVTTELPTHPHWSGSPSSKLLGTLSGSRARVPLRACCDRSSLNCSAVLANYSSDHDLSPLYCFPFSHPPPLTPGVSQLAYHGVIGTLYLAAYEV